MIHTERELRVLLQTAKAMPAGTAKCERIDAVLRSADAAGLDAFAVEARLGAMSDYAEIGDTKRELLALSLCLATLDRRPEVVQPGLHRRLLWALKAAPMDLVRFPEIPLASIEEVFAAAERHFRLSGYSLHGLLQFRMYVALHLGQHEAALRWHDEFVLAKPDSMSSCTACVPSYLIECYEETGQDERAVALSERSNRLTCHGQPAWLLSHTLIPYVRTGNLAAAAEAQQRAYPAMRNSSWLHGVGLHLVYFALAGREVRGLELVERHLSWLDTSPSPFQTMEFASGAVMNLRRIIDSGHGDTIVRDRRQGTPSETTVVALCEELATTAVDIAAQFDARNGNTHYTDRLSQRSVIAAR